MKKTTLALIALALIVSMLFSCSNAQQESSVPESGEQEITASKSSAERPSGEYPDEFTENGIAYRRVEEGSNAFYAHGTGNENWIWDQRCGNGLGSKPEVIFTQPPTVLQRADGDFRVFGRASGSGEMVLLKSNEDKSFTQTECFAVLEDGKIVEIRGGAVVLKLPEGKYEDRYTFYNANDEGTIPKYFNLVTAREEEYDYIGWNGFTRTAIKITDSGYEFTRQEPRLDSEKEVGGEKVSVYCYDLYAGADSSKLDLRLDRLYFTKHGEKLIKQTQCEPQITDRYILFDEDGYKLYTLQNGGFYQSALTADKEANWSRISISSGSEYILASKPSGATEAIIFKTCIFNSKGEMVYEYTDGILEYSSYGGIIIYPNFTYGKLDEIMKK